MTLKREILVIEDEIEISNSIEKLLLQFNFSTKHVLAAETALNKLDLTDYDFIITDWNLAENCLNGLEFCKEIKKRKIKVPVVLCSAYTINEISKEDLNVVDAYINKPLDSHKFVSLLYQLNIILDGFDDTNIELKQIKENNDAIVLNIDDVKNIFDLFRDTKKYLFNLNKKNNDLNKEKDKNEENKFERKKQVEEFKFIIECTNNKFNDLNRYFSLCINNYQIESNNAIIFYDIIELILNTTKLDIRRYKKINDVTINFICNENNKDDLHISYKPELLYLINKTLSLFINNLEKGKIIFEIILREDNLYEINFLFQNINPTSKGLENLAKYNDVIINKKQLFELDSDLDYIRKLYNLMDDNILIELNKDYTHLTFKLKSCVFAPIDWKSKTILIGEDEEFNYRLIVKTLHRLGINTLWAENGKEVVEICEDFNIKLDLILLDIKMPVMNGFDASQKIKEIRSDIPIIGQTAYASLFQDDYPIGIFDGYLTKPIRPNILINTLAKFLV